MKEHGHFIICHGTHFVSKFKKKLYLLTTMYRAQNKIWTVAGHLDQPKKV